MAILAQAILVRTSHCFSVLKSCGFSFCILTRRSVMPRKGWSAMETPAGWYQVLRDPRPKLEEWPQLQP